MRISDWSSDVCSSDLHDQPVRVAIQRDSDIRAHFPDAGLQRGRMGGAAFVVDVGAVRRDAERDHFSAQFPERGRRDLVGGAIGAIDHDPQPIRSEEHTSELQSLMRISYAVFCLKKKTTQTT